MARIESDMCGHHVRGIREVEPIQRFHQIPFRVVDLNAASRRRTRDRLRHKKQLVHRIEPNIRAALNLSCASGQYYSNTGLSLQIVELDSEIQFGGCNCYPVF